MSRNTPPGAIECRFGPGSFQKHCDQVRDKALPLKVMRPPGLLFDIDTIDDVLRLERELGSMPDGLAPNVRAWFRAGQALPTLPTPPT